jgi:hypothetical protein
MASCASRNATISANSSAAAFALIAMAVRAGTL